MTKSRSFYRQAGVGVFVKRSGRVQHRIISAVAMGNEKEWEWWAASLAWVFWLSLLFGAAADKLLAWVFQKVTYELWGSRVRLSRLGFGIFWMHFVKHIFPSLNSKFYSNPLSLSGTVIPQSSANLLSTKSVYLKVKESFYFSVAVDLPYSASGKIDN